jgi:maleylpyruvate isomerase
MRLHGFFRSGTSYRVRIALAFKRIAYETVPVSLPKAAHRAPEFLQLNAQGLVPVLETDEGALVQSPAILEYLEERFPDPPLLPHDRLARTRVRAMAAVIACDIHPINNLRVLNYLRSQLSQPEAAVTNWIGHWITAGFDAIEEQLGASALGGPFCFGQNPTLADVCLIPQVYSARRFGVALDSYPRIVAIDRACSQLPEFQQAHPDNQSDAK